METRGRSGAADVAPQRAHRGRAESARSTEEGARGRTRHQASADDAADPHQGPFEAGAAGPSTGNSKQVPREVAHASACDRFSIHSLPRNVVQSLTLRPLFTQL